MYCTYYLKKFNLFNFFFFYDGVDKMYGSYVNYLFLLLCASISISVLWK